MAMQKKKYKRTNDDLQNTGADSKGGGGYDFHTKYSQKIFKCAPPP